MSWWIDDGTDPTSVKEEYFVPDFSPLAPGDRDSLISAARDKLPAWQAGYEAGDYQDVYDEVSNFNLELVRYRVKDTTDYFVDETGMSENISRFKTPILSNSGAFEEAVGSLPSLEDEQASGQTFNFEKALLVINVLFVAEKYDQARKAVDLALNYRSSTKDSASLLTVLQYEQRLIIYHKILEFRTQHRKAIQSDWEKMNEARDSLLRMVFVHGETIEEGLEEAFEVRKHFFAAEANWHAMEMTNFFSYLAKTRSSLDKAFTHLPKKSALRNKIKKLYFDLLYFETKVCLERPNIADPANDYCFYERDDPLYDEYKTLDSTRALLIIDSLLKQPAYRFFPAIDLLQRTRLQVFGSKLYIGDISTGSDIPFTNEGSSAIEIKRQFLSTGPLQQLQKLEHNLAARLRYEGQKRREVELQTGGLFLIGILLFSFFILGVLGIWKNETSKQEVAKELKSLTFRLAEFEHEKEVMEEERARHAAIKGELSTALQEADIVENDLSHRVVNQLLGIVGVSRRLAEQATTPQQLSARLKVAIFEAIGLHRMLEENHQHEYLNVAAYFQRFTKPVQESLGIELVVAATNMAKSKELPAHLTSDLGAILMEFLFLGNANNAQLIFLDVSTKGKKLTLQIDVATEQLQKSTGKVLVSATEMHSATELRHLDRYLQKLGATLEQAPANRNGAEVSRFVLQIPV